MGNQQGGNHKKRKGKQNQQKINASQFQEGGIIQGDYILIEKFFDGDPKDYANQNRMITDDHNEDQDIIIIQNADEMAKEFFKEYEIVWHDPNIKSGDNQIYLKRLRSISCIKAFSEVVPMAQYLSQNSRKYCFLITAGTNGCKLLEQVHQMTSIEQAYVFCMNVDGNKQWASNFPIIKLVTNDFQDIKIAIESYMQDNPNQNKLHFPQFSTIFDEDDIGDIYHLHQFLQSIKNFRNRKQAMNDFIKLCKVLSQDERISEFQQEYTQYDKAKIVYWYTVECFFYKITNKCLRIATNNSIQYCRLILKDLQRAILEIYLEKTYKFSGLLYRGAYITDQEWEKLQQNKGKHIEMQGFLSTSLNKQKTLNQFLRDPKAILITIIVSGQDLDNTLGFAEIQQYSAIANEEEVLFNVMSIFTIIEAREEMVEGQMRRHLVLFYGLYNQMMKIHSRESTVSRKIENLSGKVCEICQLDQNPENHYFINMYDNKTMICIDCLQSNADIKDPFCYIPKNAFEVDEFSFDIVCLLIKYNHMPEIPFYGYQCSICGNSPQMPYFRCLTCDDKKHIKNKICFECFNVQRIDCFYSDHQIVLERSPFTIWTDSFQNFTKVQKKFGFQYQHTLDQIHQQDVFIQQEDYNSAQEYISQQISKLEQKGDLNLELIEAYRNMSFVYNKMNLHTQALKFIDKAIEYKIQYLQYQDDQIIDIFDEICNKVDILLELGQYADAYSTLDEFYTNLKQEIDDNILPYKGDYILKLVSILVEQEKYIEARQMLIDSYRFFQNSDIKMINFYYLVGINNFNIKAQNNNDYALEYFTKSLRLSESVYGRQHRNSIAINLQIGELFMEMNNFNDALPYLEQSLKISQSYKNNQARTGVCLMLLGKCYEGMNDLDRARDLATESVTLIDSSLHSNHINKAKAHYNLGRILFKRKEFDHCSSYLEEAERIFKLIKGNDYKIAIEIREIIDQVKFENFRILQQLQEIQESFNQEGI